MEYQYETVKTDDKMPLRILAHEEVNGNRHVNKHWHQSIELIFCTKGSITCFINAKRHIIAENELLLINSNVIHSLYSTLEDKGIILQIPIQYLLSYYQEHPHVYFDIEQSNKTYILVELQALMLEMFRLKTEKLQGYDLRIHSLLYELEYILITHFAIEKNTNDVHIKTHKYLSRLSEIVEYLNEHYREDIYLEDVAEHFSLAPQYLSRFFKKYANISFSEYLNSIRLDHASRDLMNTDDSILCIALNNGFSNPRSFSNAFKNIYGMNPSVFKKK